MGESRRRAETVLDVALFAAIMLPAVAAALLVASADRGIQRLAAVALVPGTAVGGRTRPDAPDRA